MGGEGQIVEIDESHFVKVKHHRGKDLRRPAVWVFGIYERATTHCVFCIVPSRDATTLLNVIYKHVLPGTTIYSDCWSAYRRIQKLDAGFVHKQVNHDLCFVDAHTGAHTNGIESSWNSAKTHLKNMRGVNRAHLTSYLDEFCWRHNRNVLRAKAGELILEEAGRVAVDWANLSKIDEEQLAESMANLGLEGESEDEDELDLETIEQYKGPLDDYPPMSPRIESTVSPNFSCSPPSPPRFETPRATVRSVRSRKAVAAACASLTAVIPSNDHVKAVVESKEKDPTVKRRRGRPRKAVAKPIAEEPTNSQEIEQNSIKKVYSLRARK